MSAANRGARREDRDHYPTPLWAVDRLLDALPWILRTRRILEPCAGEGAVLQALRRRGWSGHATAIEVREEARSALEKIADEVIIGDALALAETLGEFDAVVTNPPYSQALEFVQTFRPLAPASAHLLRVSFLGSTKRHAWLSKNTPSVYVLPNRPSFVRGGSDNCEYAWMTWEIEEAAPVVRILGLTDRKERAVRGIRERTQLEILERMEIKEC